jgi:hypothetical protein
MTFWKPAWLPSSCKPEISTQYGGQLRKSYSQSLGTTVALPKCLTLLKIKIIDVKKQDGGKSPEEDCFT